MSRTIDERVVEMRFDNRDFEKNIDASIKSIESLKKALNFDNVKDSAKELEKISDAANEVDFDKMADQLDRLSNRFSTLGIVGMTTISRLTNAAIDFGKNLYGNTIGQIKSGGLSRALNIEEAKFQLKGLGVEWDHIKDDIDYGVSGTAYGLDAAAKAASQLVASGVQLGDNMKASLRGISGVAAMTSSSYEEISHIFTTVAGQGKVMTMQLRQLENRGLNAAASLGEALGKTEAEIRDMVTKGKIDFETFSKAMDEAFGEHAKDANSTFEGALSNMKAALSRIGQNFYTPYLDNMRRVFNSLRLMFNQVNTLLVPFNKIFEQVMIKYADFVESVLGSSEMTEILKNTFAGLEHILNGILTLIYPIQTAFQNVFPEGFLGTLVKVSKGWRDITEEFGLSRNGMLRLRMTFEGIFKVLKLFGSIVFNITGTTLPYFVKMLRIVGGVLNALTSLIASILGDIAGVASELSPLQIVLSGVSIILNVITNALGLLAVGIIKVLNVLQDLHIVNVIGETLKFIGKLISDIVASIPELIDKFMSLNIVQRVLSGVISGLQIVGKVISTIIAMGIAGITALINKIIELERKFQVFNRIGNGFNTFINAIKNLKNEIVDAFKRISSGEKIVDIFKEKLSKIAVVFDKFKNGVIDKFSSVYNSKWFDWLRDLADKFDGLKKPTEESTNFIQKFIDLIKNNAGKIAVVAFVGLITAVTLSFKKFLDAGTQLIQGTTGIIGTFKKLFDPVVKQKTKIQQVTDMIGMLTIAIGALAAIDRYGDLHNVVVAFAELSAVIAGLGLAFTAFDILGKKFGGNKSINSMTKTLIGLSAAAAAMSLAIGVLGSIPFEQGLKNVALLGIILTELVGASLVMSKFAPKLTAGALLLIPMAAAVDKFVNALVNLNKVRTDNLAGNILALGAIMAAFGAMAAGLGQIRLSSVIGMWLLLNNIEKVFVIIQDIGNTFDFSKFAETFKNNWFAITLLIGGMIGAIQLLKGAGPGLQKFGSGLILISAAIGLLTIIAKQIGKVPLPQLKKGGTILACLMGITALLEYLSKFTKKNSMIKFAAGMVLLTGAFAIMGKLAATIGKVSFIQLAKGTAILAALSGMIAALEHFSGDTAKSKVSVILALCVTISWLATELMVLSFIPWQDMLAPLAAMAIVLGGFAAVIKAVGYLAKESANSKGVIRSLIVTVLGIGAMSLALIELSKYDWHSVLAAGIGMSAAMSAFAKVIKAVGSIKGGMGKNGWNTIIASVIGLGAVAAAMWALSNYGGDWQKLIASAVGMSVALLAFSKAFSIIAKSKSEWNVNKINNVVAAFAGLVGITAALIAVSNLGGDWDKIVAAGAGLALALTGFGVAFGVMSKLANGTKISASVVASIVATSLATIPLGAALGLLASFDWKGSIYQAALGLSIAMGAMSGVVVILSKFSTNAVGAIAGAFAMIEVATSLVVVAHALTMFSNADVEWSTVGKAVAIMAAIGGAITILGKAVGPLSAIAGGGSLFIAATSMIVLAQAMEQFANVEWSTIGQASVMIGVLTAAVAALGLIGPVSLAGAGALLAASGALLLAGIGLQKTAAAFDMFAGVVEHFGQVLATIDGPSISSNIQQIAEGLGSLVEPMLGVASAVLEFGSAMVVMTVGLPALVTLGVAIGVLAGLFPKLVEPFANFVESFQILCTLDASNVVDSIVKLVEGLGILAGANLLLGGFHDLTESLTDFARSIDDLSNSSTNLTTVIDTMEQLGDATADVAIKMEENGNKVIDIADRVFGKELHDTLKKSAGYAVGGFVEGLDFGPAKAAMAQGGHDILESFYSAVGQGSNWATMILSGGWSVGGFVEGFKSSLPSALGMVFDAGKSIISNFNSGVSSEKVNTSPIDNIKESISGIAELSGAKDTIDGIGNSIKNIGNINLDGVKDGLNGVKDSISDLINGKGSVVDLINQTGILGNSLDEGTDSTNILTDAINNLVGTDNGSSGGSTGGGLKGVGKAASVTSQDMEKLKKAQESLYMSTDVLLKEYSDFYDKLGITDAPEKAEAALKSLGMTVEEFGDMWQGIEDKAKSALDNIFDTPKDRGWIDKDAILYNMRENLNQVSQWADSLGRLGEKAGTSLSKELYEKLSEMGPEGYKYVHAFSEMTDDELKQVSSMFQESMTLPTAAANRISAGFLNAGVMSVAGFANGIREMEPALSAVNEFSDTVAQTLHDGALEFGSPSEYMRQLGVWSDVGYAIGIYEGIDQIVFAIQVICDRIITEFQLRLTGDEMAQLGQEFITKLATGMMLSVSTFDLIVDELVAAIIESIDSRSEQIHQNGRYICKYLVEGFRDEVTVQQPEIDAAIDKMVEFMLDRFEEDHEEDFEDMAEFFVIAACEALNDEKRSYTHWAESFDLMMEFIDEILRAYYDRYVEIGAYWVDGLIDGLNSKLGELDIVVAGIGDRVAAIQSLSLGVASPSKIARQIGRYWTKGLALGINDYSKYPTENAKKIAKSIIKVTNSQSPQIANALKTIIKKNENVTVKQLAKSMARITDTIQVYKVTDKFAAMFVPVNKMMKTTADTSVKQVRRIVVAISSGTKDVNKRIQQALNFAKKLNADLKSYKSIDDIIKKMKTINDYFIKFNAVPPKVKKFLGQIETSMKPVNKLLKEMGEEFYKIPNMLSMMTRETNSARMGMLKFASTILDQTTSGKDYAKMLSDLTEAEQELTNAKLYGKDTEDIQNKIDELEAQLKAVDGVKIASKALKEYQKVLASTIEQNMDMWQSFDPGESFSATSLVSNMSGNINAVKDWSSAMVKLAKSALDTDVLDELRQSGLESYSKALALADADPKTIALINYRRDQQKKQAAKAAKEVIKAMSYAYTDEAEAQRKKLAEEMNAGDKLFLKLYDGHLEKLDKFLLKYSSDTEEYATVLKHLETVTTSISGPMEIVKWRIGAVSDQTKSASEIAMEAYDGFLHLGDAFGVVADSANNTVGYIDSLKQKFDEWMDTVREGLTVQNPFEKFEQDTSYSVEQLKYNINSQLQAIRDFTAGIEAMKNMGYSTELIKYVGSLGYENGSKYVNGFVQAEKNEVGYFNEAYRDILTIPDDLAEQIGADLIETGTKMGKALIDGVNKYYEEVGVTIPLTDPSQEDLESAEEAGEQIADSIADGIEEEFEYRAPTMITDGITQGLDAAQPTILKSAEKSASAMANAYSETLQKADIGTTVGKSISTGITTGMSQAMPDMSNSIMSSMRTLATDIVRLFEETGRNATKPIVDRFQEAVNKIKSLINSLPRNIDIVIDLDSQRAEDAIDRLNEKIEELKYTASQAYDAVNKANSTKSKKEEEEEEAEGDEDTASATTKVRGTSIVVNQTINTNVDNSRAAIYKAAAKSGAIAGATSGGLVVV